MTSEVVRLTREVDLRRQPNMRTLVEMRGARGQRTVVVVI